MRTARAVAPSPALARLTALGCLLAALSGAPAGAQERVEGNTYRNPRYGIEIGKPGDWYFITAGTVLDLAQKAAGGERPRPEADPVKAAGFAVVVSKVPSLGRGVDPQAVLLVRDAPEPSPGLVAVCEAIRQGMLEPETVRPTRQVRLGGQPAVRLDFQGLVDGAQVRATALCTVRDRRVLAVVGQALSAEFDGAAAAFEAIIQSFRLQ